MSSLPLHPSLVHVPIGLAVVIPLVAVGVVIAWWRGWLGKRAWFLVVGLQAALLFGGIASYSTGESEAERVERAVSEDRVHDHEEAAEIFLWVAGLVFACALAGALVRDERLERAAVGVATLGTIAVLILAINVGHEGGELVYAHGAACVERAP